MRATIPSVATVLSVAVLFSPSTQAQELGDERAMTFHILQGDINNGRVSGTQLRKAGNLFFRAPFTIEDGAGRPGATGSGIPTRRPLVGARAFLRTSGPDANSCFGCHNTPESGGSGDVVANVFLGAQEREPVLMSVAPEFSAERRTPELHGAGLIELLAREMTHDLHTIRDRAKEEARLAGRSVRVRLITKGVDFGFLSAAPDGSLRTTEVEGVDKDLVIRPWSQKGTVTSLRAFSVTALNQHHGIQADERYGVRQTGAIDFDRDGVNLEFTQGDVTALVLYQATLPPPAQIIPKSEARKSAVVRGSALFDQIGCAECHRKELELESPIFTEPGPYNLEGTLRRSEVSRPFSQDLTMLSWGKALPKTQTGKVLVRAFTDLKRHRIADGDDQFFANEIVSQGLTSTDEFLTRRLWTAGNGGPYGHSGNLTTLREAILHHAGEARGARLQFSKLSKDDQGSVIEYLKTLKTATFSSHLVLGESETDPDLTALSSRWAESGQREASEVVQVLERCKAAVHRGNANNDRAEVLALRVSFEREKAGIDSAPKDRALPLDAYRLKDVLNREYESLVPVEVREGISELEISLAQVNLAYSNAMKNAEFAHAVSPSDQQIGRLSSETVAEKLRNERDQLARLSLLMSWCDELAFRTDQLTQRTAMAALRAEAEASRRIAQRP